MKLFPYLGFNGNCEEALNFYKDALEGKILQLGKYGDAAMDSPAELKDKVIHGRLQFGEALIMASDMPKENYTTEKNTISLSVECNTIEQLKKVFAAMAEGGTITMPLQDQFWGARFGMLIDKFGISWMFNCEKKNEEVEATDKNLDTI